MTLCKYDHRRHIACDQLCLSLDMHKEVKNRILELKSAELVPIERELLAKEYEVDVKK